MIAECSTPPEPEHRETAGTRIHIGGVFVIGFLTALLGVVLLAVSIPTFGPFFRGEIMEPDPDTAPEIRDGS